MDIIEPIKNGFTIYSKSGCLQCTKVKIFLLEKNMFFLDCNCDEYIIEDKKGFLLSIHKFAKKEVTTFPIIFYNSIFIGSYNEIKDYVNKLSLSFDDIS